jgi:hypothetical protein
MGCAHSLCCGSCIYLRRSSDEGLDCFPFGASLPLQRFSMRLKEKEGKTITRENVLEVSQCIRWTRMCRPPSKAAEMRSCGISAKAEMLSSAGHLPKHSLFEGAICEGPQGLLEVYVFRPPPLLSPPQWMSTLLPTLPRKLLSVERIHPRRFFTTSPRCGGVMDWIAWRMSDNISTLSLIVEHTAESRLRFFDGLLFSPLSSSLLNAGKESNEISSGAVRNVNVNTSETSSGPPILSAAPITSTRFPSPDIPVEVFGTKL